MPGYDVVKFITVTLPEWDFGQDIDEIVSFRLPTTWTAKLVKIGIAVTETFACDSTVANILLGTAADPNAYAQLEIADATADVDFFDETDDTDAIIAADIAADTLLQVTLTQSTDGTADAGKGLPMFFFELHSGD